MDQSSDPIEQELPDHHPSCAVSRAMAKKVMLTGNQSDVDMPDTFIGQSFKNEITKSRESETDSIKFKISSKTPRGKKDSTKRHHHRHHKRQQGEQQFP